MLLETVLLILFLMSLNILFAYKPKPIIAFPVGVATIGILATQVLNDSSLPYQPFLTLLFLLITIGCIVVNAFEFEN